MTPSEYQEFALITANPPRVGGIDEHSKTGLVYAALGLAGEAGEVADAIKKIENHHHPFIGDEVALKELCLEIGDAQWYVALLCSRMQEFVPDFTLERCMEMNIEKLKKRYPNKFTVQDSIRRIDVNG